MSSRGRAPNRALVRRRERGRRLVDRARRPRHARRRRGAAARRLPTHSTRYEFHLPDFSLADFTIPYYFHLEPTLVLGGALGRFMFVVNQGAIAFVGPDGNFAEQHVTVPSLLFWDAHYAVSYSPWAFLGASRRALPPQKSSSITSATRTT